MPKFEEQMALLRGRFRQRCVEKHAELQAAVELVDLSRIAAIGHSIAGNAGMFGYPDLSRIARDLELAADGADGTMLRVRANAVLEELERVSRSSV